jgi:hypothetical protein
MSARLYWRCAPKASGRPLALASKQFIGHSTQRCEVRVANGLPPVNPLAALTLLPLTIGAMLAAPAPRSRIADPGDVVLRVPVQPRPPMPHFNWREHKGPECFPIGAIRRALLSGPSQVDFILGNGSRVRAKFDKDCPALDYYGNFYLQPQGNVLCAGRDAIHSRMGGSCVIRRFRLLEPRLP